LDQLGPVSAWSSSASDFKVLHWAWARRAGDSSVDRAYALAVDGSGNAYVGGGFVGTVDFLADWPSGSDSRTGTGSDGFVMKINPDGTYAWVRRIGGTGAEWVEDLATDASGNVFVAGKFAGTVDFRADWGGAADSRTASGDDAFLMRINVDGSYGWTKQIGGPNNDRINELAVDGSGNLFAGGNFDGTVNFQADWSGTDSRTGASNDGFVLKVNSDGSYGWTKAMGSTGMDTVMGLATTPSGAVFVTGYFSATVNFQADWSGTDSKTSAGAMDIFLLRIQPDGSYGWTRRIGGTGTDGAYSACTDSTGNVYLAGGFNSTVDFRADWGGGSDSRASAGSSDIFVTLVNSDGSYGWTRVAGGTSNDQASDVAVDASGNLFLTGSFDGTVDFRAGWGGGTDIKTGTVQDAFLLRIDAGGSYGWAMSFGGASLDAGTGLALDGNGNLTLAGYFRGAVDFRADWGGGSESKSSTGGSSDIFAIKLR